MTDKEKKEVEQVNSLKALQETHQEFLKTAGPGMAYGRPVKNGDITVIPASEVLVFSGFGYGSGSGQGPMEGSEETAEGSGEGGAGGGKTLSRPVAVVVATPDGVWVEPVYDITKVYMAAITAAGFMLAMLVRLARPWRAFSK
jgi:uncharacterized spore protein YtfJ